MGAPPSLLSAPREVSAGKKTNARCPSTAAPIAAPIAVPIPWPRLLPFLLRREQQTTPQIQLARSRRPSPSSRKACPDPLRMPIGPKTRDSKAIPASEALLADSCVPFDSASCFAFARA